NYSNSDMKLTYEQGGNTLIVPSNEAINKFVNEKLLRYANTLSELSVDVVAAFLKSHMIPNLVWPSMFQTSQNANGEFLNGEGGRGPSFNESSIKEARIASNGILYYSDEVIKSKYFETVYSEILLNPACNLLNIAFNKYYSSIVDDLMKSPLTGFTDENYTLIIPADELLMADGYTYNEGDDTFSNEDLLGSLTVDDRLRRLIRMGIFYRDQNTELKDFTGGLLSEYEGYGYAVNSYGEMIRYRNNELQGVGNIKSGEVVNLEYIDEFNNGHVFKMDKLLQYSPRMTNPTEAGGWEDQSLYNCLKEYVESNPNATIFFEYLTKTLYSATEGTISGVSASSFYTVLVLQDDILQELINTGILPEPSSSLLDITSGDYDAEIAENVANFVSIHLLGGTVVPDDGLTVIMPGNYSSLILSTAYRVTDLDLDLISEKTDVVVRKENGKLIFTPRNIESGNKILVEGIGEATVIRDIKKSNYMGPRAVIHAIDSYLSFKVNSPNNQ
ncbi:MAG: fasciclin domain-containing protein, partial [Bacteroides sp.]|nr:fasciclin domain-containing protein [Bacteroides sp.]